ncbi:hypothetical protein Ancab_022123 [Ancistrocladus abbreviatus]
MKREKWRKKKGKCASEPYPADFSEDQNVSWMKEGCSLQPIMEQAHLYKADKVDEIKGPSEMKRKKAQEKPEGEWENSRPNIGEIQKKKCNKKKKASPARKKV